MERALAIQGREYGTEHLIAATTLAELGNACWNLRDAARRWDLLERALVIQGREYGTELINATALANNR